MSCEIGQNLLHKHLDGDLPAAALEQHLQECPECEADRAAIGRLLRGLGKLGRLTPLPPPGLAQHLGNVVRADLAARRFRRWRLRASLAAVAALLVVGLSSWLWPVPPLSSPAPQNNLAQRQPPPTIEPMRPEPLKSSMEEAGSAVASLTSRTASSLPGPSLWMLGSQSTLPDMLPTMEADMGSPAVIEPALQPLQEASAQVQAGLAPVADSARRAFSLLIRDLPMNRHSAANKPG